MVGGSDVPHSQEVKMLVHAVLWRDGAPIDLGALSPQGGSLAYAVNGEDEVVGKQTCKMAKRLSFTNAGA